MRDDENLVLDSKNAACAGPAACAAEELGRRDMLRLAGGAAAATALVACGGDEPTEPLPASCAGVLATGAEKLAVGKALVFDQPSPNTFKSFIVARDEAGFYALANVCSHSACQTKFNEGAKTFDCPCHGSKYSFDGTRIMGPANDSFRAFALCKRQDGMFFVNNETFIVRDPKLRIK